MNLVNIKDFLKNRENVFIVMLSCIILFLLYRLYNVKYESFLDNHNANSNSNSNAVQEAVREYKKTE